jgi:hypothetical protein
MTMVIIHNPAITDVWDKKNDRNSEIPSSQDTRVVPSAKWASLYASRRRSLPLRICAYHLCTPDTPYYQMLHAFNAMMMKADERCRMKIHVGTYLLYEISTAHHHNATLFQSSYLPNMPAAATRCSCLILTLS